MTTARTLPQGWSTARLDSLGTIVTGSTPSTVDRSNYGHSYMFVSPADLGRSKYIATTAKMLSPKGFALSRRVPRGSTLFVCIGSTIGKIGLAAKDLSTNQQINSIIPNGRFDPEFVYYAASTLSAFVREQASEQAVPLINKTEFCAFEVLRPPVPEQRAIAAALRDADELIDSLDRLIAKKQAIRRGMMQQLLTGRTRLPNFTTPWQSLRLAEVLEYEQPGKYLVSTTQQLDSGPVPVLTAGKTFVLGYTNDVDGVYKAHPVIIFDDFTTASKYVDFDFKAKSSAMKILSARPRFDLRFIYERMQLIDLMLGDHKRYWISEYGKQEIDIPDTTEQAAVSRVIADTSAEIALLQARLEKARDIKQGMMQELLSGRTRLPVAGGAA
jgi:type I restriction enzyme S subunit